MSSARDELVLRELRTLRGATQQDVADSMVTTQSAVARLEAQDDVRVSTLGRYVTALGGRLRLVADFADGEQPITLPALAPRQPREFRVLWQDPTTRALVEVGILHDLGTFFTFAYTDAAREHDGFAPLPGLLDMHRDYRSEGLFPFFDERAARAAGSSKELAEAFGLSKRDAEPVELLARSWGISPHDTTVQVVPMPTAHADGRLTVLFLASGVRHVVAESPQVRETALQSLRRGDTLDVVPEPDNEADANALLLAVAAEPVAYLPAYLARLLAEQHRHADVEVLVEHVNGPSTASHLRLLCRLFIGG